MSRICAAVLACLLPAAQAQPAVDIEERMRQIAEDDRRNLPSTLQTLSLPELCMQVGEVLRGRKPILAPDMGDEALPIMQAEVRRRGTSINDSLAKAESIAIGASECTLYASMGKPQRNNRTVTAKGVQQQLIYGRQYVYTVNGTVTAWQD